MSNFLITYWTGETTTIKADSLTEAFELHYGGPVTSTGYNVEGVWFAVDSDESTFGTVLNNSGDECGTITEAPSQDDIRAHLTTVRELPSRALARGYLISLSVAEIEAAYHATGRHIPHGGPVPTGERRIITMVNRIIGAQRTD